VPEPAFTAARTRETPINRYAGLSVCRHFRPSNRKPQDAMSSWAMSSLIFPESALELIDGQNAPNDSSNSYFAPKRQV
jgi:hypothetical protein